MSNEPLFIILCSGEHEKIQMAAMIASVAAVSETPVHVFVSMAAMYAFRKGIPDAERYRGGPFSDVLKDRKAPDAMLLFEQGKQLGEMTIHACSMALDVLDWREDDLVEDLFDGSMGLTKYLSDAENGRLVTL